MPDVPRDHAEMATSHVTGSIDVNTLLAFLFGVIFLSIMLGFAVYFPNPTPFQLQVFMTALSTAAAGVGAVLPGYLDVQFKGVLRAGGALALFAVVWFSQPLIQRAAVTLSVPPESPDPAIERFLNDLDSGNVDASYADLDPVTRETLVQTKTLWAQLYDANMRGLGSLESRTLLGVDAVTSPPGYPIGIYRQFRYAAKYSDSAGCRAEQVTVRATQDNQWRVYSFEISPIAIECPANYGSRKSTS